VNIRTRLFNRTFAVLGLLALTLVACGGSAAADGENNGAVQAAAATAIPVTGSGSVRTLEETYDDALTIRNQLVLGTLRLEDTGKAVSAGQAEELLVLWRAFAALSSSGIAAPEETEALQNQITEAMTPEQISAIADMHLTNADLQEFYVEVGLTEVKTPEPDVTPQGTRGRDLSQEDREATRVASGEDVSTFSGGSGKSSELLDMVIELLESK
jgi:hypothetical protein